MFCYIGIMEKLILLFVGFFSLTIYSYSQPNKPIVSEGVYTKEADYADLIVYHLNSKHNTFNARFEWTTPKAPFEGIKLKGNESKFTFLMTVSEFIKQMEWEGWELHSWSARGLGRNFTQSQYLFRKE